MGVRIVTDSTADLTPAQRQQYGIEMVPLTVHFGPESFKDAVEMDSAAFWAKLRSSPHHPRTAQPAPGDFLDVYKRLADAGEEIISLHISSRLSGTVGSAQIAAQMLPEAKVTVIDTKSVSMGLGMLVLGAARMAQEGKPAAEIVQWVRDVASRMHIFFTLDTLEFLQKNGRIGKAQALLGGLLGIKPILQVDREGLVAPADKVRGRSKVLGRTLELMQERVPAGRKIRLTVLHTQAPQEAESWLDEVRKLYQVEEHFVADLGSVVATHAGPGTIGLCFYEV
jgi:DegV family protein with EDD domain